jgi:enhancing lycopene biosynthesis protein 2
MSEKKVIGVILSGAGYLDGAEIQEAVCSLLALSDGGAETRIFAPDMELDEVDHLSGEPTGQKRNVLTESARIARGNVENIKDVQGTDVDGWILPGGFGAAKNLSSFATEGGAATADKDVTRVIREALAAQMPIGACCIAPALLAVVTKSSGPSLTLTIGKDADTAGAMSQMGAKHVNCAVDEVAIDENHHVVTAPAYMYDASLADVNAGIRKMVQQVLAWA